MLIFLTPLRISPRSSLLLRLTATSIESPSSPSRWIRSLNFTEVESLWKLSNSPMQICTDVLSKKGSPAESSKKRFFSSSSFAKKLLWQRRRRGEATWRRNPPPTSKNQRGLFGHYEATFSGRQVRFGLWRGHFHGEAVWWGQNRLH